MRMNGAGRAELVRQRLPLTAGAQHIDDRGKDLPRRHWLSARARLALIGSIRSPLPHGHQRLDLAPKCVGYGPGLDLRHEADRRSDQDTAHKTISQGTAKCTICG